MNTAAQHGRMNHVKGIHPEVAELLKDKSITLSVISVLRKVKPVRQIEMAKLMVNMSNYTRVYANALLLATSPDQMVNGDTFKEETRIPAREIACIESEMKSLEHDFKEIQHRYSRNMLEFTIVQAYLRRLLQNKKIIRFLKSRYPELYLEIESIAALEAL